MSEIIHSFPPELLEKEHSEIDAQLLLFYNMAEALQEPNLPYHNWENHVRAAYTQARRLCDLYEAKREPDEPEVNTLVVGLAILGHDSGYSHFETVADLHAKTGFDSKEAYSVDITTTLLRGAGYEEDIIDQVAVCIMGTKLGAECPTLEAKIVRRADLFNIAGDYEYFHRNSLAFREEINMFRCKNGEKELSIKEFVQISSVILSEYLRDDFKLGDWDAHPFEHSNFFVGATLNILKLFKQYGVVLSDPVKDMAIDLLHLEAS